MEDEEEDIKNESNSGEQITGEKSSE